MVFYRKYRPQTIDELDSDAVKTAIHTVLSDKTTPHAFLFTGPKGLGKTSTARIVAKYVNCESKGKKPCNKCNSCVSITQGTNVDILEIDGASNRGIDEIRDVREKIRLLPQAAKKKVYIIDEVHMLTTEAFNALLKTLEEPPAHAMLILCTTEPHKIPATILSRCFHIAFKKATSADLVRSFQRIIQGESIMADLQVLAYIASFAEGSFRDGAKILEEITRTAGGKKITIDMVESMYHKTSTDHYVLDLLKALQENDRKKALETVQNLVEQGIDIPYFLEQVLVTLHKALLIKMGVMEETEAFAIDLETIKKLVAVFSKAHGEVKSAVLPQLPLELAIVEWSAASPQKESTEESVETKAPDTTHAVSSPKTEIAQTTRSTPSANKGLFHNLLDAIKHEHYMIAGVLRSCIIEQNENGITIIAPSPFHKQRLSEKKALDVLQKVCEDITGKSGTIAIVLKS